MEYITLNNGVKMPLIGYGTYKVKDTEECINCVYNAIKAGYRLIDTAQNYENEKEVGLGIQKAINEGIVTRDDLFITTKVWFKSYEREDCIASLEASFEKLGLEYIDLVLLHWPFGNVYSAWRVLEEYYQKGKIRAIGVSNMTADRFIDLMYFNKCNPSVNQIETHLYCQRLENQIWMEKYNIAHQGYAPLGQARANEMFDEPIVKQIALKYHKTKAQILLRYLIQRKISIIPKTVHIERMKENIDIFDFKLTANEMEMLKSLDKDEAMIGTAQRPQRVEQAVTWK